MACRYCPQTEHVRAYLNGDVCPAHTPAALEGRTDPIPDPDRTLEALRSAKGQPYGYRPTDSELLNDRAIATGKRRSTPAQFRAARAAEEARKQARR
jgi:hypothetical protein